MNAPSSQLTLGNIMLVHDHSMAERFNLLCRYNTFQNYNCIAVSTLTIEQRSRLPYKVLCSRQFGEGLDGLLERFKPLQAYKLIGSYPMNNIISGIQYFIT